MQHFFFCDDLRLPSSYALTYSIFTALWSSNWTGCCWFREKDKRTSTRRKENSSISWSRARRCRMVFRTCRSSVKGNTLMNNQWIMHVIYFVEFVYIWNAIIVHLGLHNSQRQRIGLRAIPSKRAVLIFNRTAVWSYVYDSGRKSKVIIS